MDYTVTTTVFATTSVIGFHAWKDAPAEVAYLASKHRHKFNIRVEIATERSPLHGSDSREIEFHTLKRYLHQYFEDNWGILLTPEGEYVFGNWPCERIAEDITDELRKQWPGRVLYRVSVDEDGENGATVEVRA